MPFYQDVELTSLSGYGGYQFSGTIPGSMTGWSVAGIGDFNGDGYADYQMKINGDVTGHWQTWLL